MFTLTGTIIDHTGAPRAYVDVDITPVPAVTPTGASLAAGGRRIRTDSLGQFSIDLVHAPGQTYQVSVPAANIFQRFPVPEADGSTIDLSEITEVMVPTPLSPVVRGLPGKSTYDLAVEQGFEGTLEEWLEAQKAVAAAHGSLTGLDDDDHPQYLTEARGDTRYEPLGTAQGLVDDLDVPTSPQDIGAQPAGDYAPATHDHDGVYQPVGDYQPAGDYAGSDHDHPEYANPDLSGYVENDDPRLTDARPPTAHRHPWADLDGAPAIPTTPEDIGAAPAGDYATNSALTSEAQVRQQADSALADDIATRQTAAQVDARVQQVIGTAPAALDTLGEIAERLADDADAVASLTSTVAGKADATHTHGAADLSGVVKTVNGEAPDGSGNVVVEGGGSVFELRGTGMPNGVVAADPGTYYTDTAGTNGAWRWLKMSGTGNTGWTVVYGDTGARNVESLHTDSTNFQTDWATITISRSGNIVTIAMNVYTLAAYTGMASVIPIPPGFRFDNYYTSGLAVSDVSQGFSWITASGVNLWLQGPPGDHNGQSTSGAIMGRTSDPWPSTLPGVPA